MLNVQYLQHASEPHNTRQAPSVCLTTTNPGSLAFLLVLTRALEFMMAIMGRLLEKPEMSMSEVVYEQYHRTLSKWHGFWATSAFNVSRGQDMG